MAEVAATHMHEGIASNHTAEDWHCKLRQKASRRLCELWQLNYKYNVHKEEKNHGSNHTLNITPYDQL
jgi:hypothetical protein